MFHNSLIGDLKLSEINFEKLAREHMHLKNYFANSNSQSVIDFK